MIHRDSRDTDHLLDALIVEGQIGHPTTVIPYSLSVFEPVLEIVDETGLSLVAVQGNIACPLVDMGPALGIHMLHMHDLVKEAQPIDPLHEDLVVIGLCR